jgi:hypothetical protein
MPFRYGDGNDIPSGPEGNDGPSGSGAPGRHAELRNAHWLDCRGLALPVSSWGQHVTSSQCARVRTCLRGKKPRRGGPMVAQGGANASETSARATLGKTGGACGLPLGDPSPDANRGFISASASLRHGGTRFARPFADWMERRSRRHGCRPHPGLRNCSCNSHLLHPGLT